VQSLEQRIQQLESRLEGQSRNESHVTGYASTTYIDAKGQPGAFSASFNPLFLFKAGERFLFEAELEFEIEEKQKTAKKATAKKGAKRVKGKRTFRFGTLTSPKGREVWPPVNREGKFLAASAAERYGKKQAPKWGRIEAETPAAALASLKAGKGDWFTPAKPEPKE